MDAADSSGIRVTGTDGDGAQGTDVKVFLLERIMDERVVDGVHMFRVRWHGFTEADDTWEPTESFVELKMIEEYRERRGGAQPIQQVSRRRGLPRCTSARTYAC